MEKLPIAKEGYPFILPLIGLTFVSCAFHVYCIATLLGLLTLFVIYFFRDPKREIPSGKGVFVSPADGKVVGITPNATTKCGDKGILINIFLNVFNVHVNRVPCAGKILETNYNPGKFLPAYREKASELNEQNNVIIEWGNNTRIHVKQIAGLIARRIVCRVKPGDELKKGDRFGLIRFGSRVDILLPPETEVNINIGDKIKGGETVIGTIKA